MNEIVVDTSVWIDFFRGENFPLLEEALKEGRALLSPIVAAELMSGACRKGERQSLQRFIEEMEIIPCPIDHWIAVGLLRGEAAKKGVNLSTPDAHLAQCALDKKGYLYTFDKVFHKLAPFIPLKLLS